MCNCQTKHPGTICCGIGCTCHGDPNAALIRADRYRLTKEMERNQRSIDNYLSLALNLEERNTFIKQQLASTKGI